MKKILMVITIAITSVLVAQDKTISSADARGKISEIIDNPAAMTSVMKQLAASDQASFLADVNAAIDDMPGSPEEKASKFLAVNTAALKGAQKGNLTTLVAEVFATVPPEALTVINESFAAGMFNRAADPSKTYTDDQYVDISTNLLAKVQERNATADNSGVRNTFAVLMLIRGSNDSPADLRDTLVASLNDAETRTLAQNEWISPALGIGQEKTYDPMLGAADAGKQPEPELVLVVPFTSASEVLFSDLARERGVTDSLSLSSIVGASVSNPNAVDVGDGANPFSTTPTAISRLPRTMNPYAKYNPGHKRGSGSSEPGGYPGQEVE